MLGRQIDGRFRVLASQPIVRGWALVVQGRQEGIAEIQPGLDAWLAVGNRIQLPFFLGLFADALMRSGNAPGAAEALDEALIRAAETEEIWWTPELHRLRGELSAAADATGDAAEQHLRRGIDLARRQGARSLELRAATSLARFLAGRGDRDAARNLLAPIHASFSEGFDTADLRDARMLLDELQRPSAKPTLLFGREGQFWTIGREGASVIRLKDMKGFRFLAHLLRNPGIEFRPLELSAIGEDTPNDAASGMASPGRREIAEAGLHAGDLGDAGEVLDARAKSAYRARLSDLREDLEAALANKDRGRVERLREEIEILTGQLAAAVGLGGRDRRAASPAERARVAVTKAIRTAISAIGREDPELGRQLHRSVHTGTMFSYHPKGQVI